jgi:flagellar biosynthesis/type III secretory pathway protein FliH
MINHDIERFINSHVIIDIGDKMDLKNSLESLEEIREDEEQFEEKELKKMVEILENIKDLSPDSNRGEEIAELSESALKIYDEIKLKLSFFKDLTPLEKAKQILRETYEQGKKDGIKEGKWKGDQEGFKRGYKKGLKDMETLKEL